MIEITESNPDRNKSAQIRIVHHSFSNLVRPHFRSYYKKGSNENRDAVELEYLLTKAITAVQNGDDVSSALGTR
jgi:hypothetical protein